MVIREYQQAALGTAQSDVAELQQTIAEREQRATEADREVAELRVQVERLESQSSTRRAPCGCNLTSCALRTCAGGWSSSTSNTRKSATSFTTSRKSKTGRGRSCGTSRTMP